MILIPILTIITILVSSFTIIVGDETQFTWRIQKLFPEINFSSYEGYVVCENRTLLCELKSFEEFKSTINRRYELIVCYHCISSSSIDLSLILSMAFENIATRGYFEIVEFVEGARYESRWSQYASLSPSNISQSNLGVNHKKRLIIEITSVMKFQGFELLKSPDIIYESSLGMIPTKEFASVIWSALKPSSSRCEHFLCRELFPCPILTANGLQILSVTKDQIEKRSKDTSRYTDIAWQHELRGRSAQVLPSGVPLFLSLDIILKSPHYQLIGQFSDMFIASEGIAISDPNLTTRIDTFRWWSRRWEIPFVDGYLRTITSSHRSGGATTSANDRIRILDAGSGYNFFPFWISMEFNADVYALDAVPELAPYYARSSNKLGLPVQFINGVLQKLPFEDASLDVIYCISVLEHTDNYAVIIAEFRRVLAPGGMLIVTFDVSFTPNFDISVTDGAMLLQLLRDAFVEVNPPKDTLNETLSLPKDIQQKTTRNTDILTTSLMRALDADHAFTNPGWRDSFKDLTISCHAFTRPTGSQRYYSKQLILDGDIVFFTIDIGNGKEDSQNINNLEITFQWLEFCKKMNVLEMLCNSSLSAILDWASNIRPPLGFADVS